MRDGDAYVDLGDLYLALVNSALAGADVDDPVMSDWIATRLADGASVLDAACGLGHDVVALHRGLPRRQTGKRFQAYGSDASSTMVEAAKRAGAHTGVPADRYATLTFAELAQHSAWHRLFDAVCVGYAIYTYPDPVPYQDYDAYLQRNLEGLKSVLRPEGHLLLNVRDWSSFLTTSSQLRRVSSEHEQVHNHQRYRCRYDWDLGPSLRSEHIARLTLSKAGTDAITSTTIRFAGRSLEDYRCAFDRAGYTVVQELPHGDAEERFITYVLRPSNN